MQIYYDAADGQIEIAALVVYANDDGDIIIKNIGSESYFMLSGKAALRFAGLIEQAVRMVTCYDSKTIRPIYPQCLSLLHNAAK